MVLQAEKEPSPAESLKTPVAVESKKRDASAVLIDGERNRKASKKFPIDLFAVTKTWTPEEGCQGHCGLEDAPLRGGRLVVNEHGQAATLSFCFKNGSKWYGVTVGHLAGIYHRIYAFKHHDSHGYAALAQLYQSR